MLLKTLGEREVREGGRERAPSLLPAAYLTARACLSVSVRASEEKERAATAKQSEPTTRKERRRKEGRKEGRKDGGGLSRSCLRSSGGFPDSLPCAAAAASIRPKGVKGLLEGAAEAEALQRRQS